jgi:dipeptidyl aminopeptidase/acylaminoacyl peptidase
MFVIGYIVAPYPAVAKIPSHHDFAMKETAGMMELGPRGLSLAYVHREYVEICRSVTLERLPVESCDGSERFLAPVKMVYIVDVATMTLVERVKIPDDADVNWLEWTSSNNLLVSITTSWKIGRRQITFPTGRVLSIKTDRSGPMVILFGQEQRLLKNNLGLAGVVHMLHDDPDHVIMGARRNNDYDLFKVNVNDGSATRIAKGKRRTNAWFTSIDGSPSIRMDCRTDSCQTIKAYRPADGADPNDEDADWVLFRTFKKKRRDDEEFLELAPISPSDNPYQYYVVAEGEGDARRSIKLIDIRTNEFIRTVFSDPVYDVSGGYINPENGQYAGAKIWRDRLEYEFVDPELTEHWGYINAYFDETFNVSLTGFSRDGQIAVVYASAPNHPGVYYLYNFETKTMETITATHSEIADGLDSTTDILSIPTRDGQSITGYHTQPGTLSYNPEGNPLIVLIHGGPETRDVYNYDRDTQFLASRGYQVLRINFRRSSGYGREFAEAGYRQWGGVMHTDIIDATRYMAAKGFTSGERTCVMGHSYGGYAALLAGALSPDDFACVVSGAGPTDLNASLAYERETHGSKSSNFEYWTKVIGDRRADRDALASISPLNLVGRYDDPVMLIHGRADRVVPATHSAEMHAALKAEGVKVTGYFPYECHHHNHWRIETSQQYFEQLEYFLQQALRPVESATDNPDSP